MKTNKLLTADQMAAKMFRLAPAIRRRAEMRAVVATELDLAICHPEVLKEANRRMRAEKR